MLPTSVTGGTWSSGHDLWSSGSQEKGINFKPGGDIPDRVRTAAWQFMGQDIPPNYGKLVFGENSLQEVQILIPNLNLFMVCYQKTFKRKRKLNKMMSPWGTHMNSLQDIQQNQGALKRERNLGINGGNDNVLHQVVQIKKIHMSQLLLLISQQMMTM